MIIAIDGPSGSGKGTIARLLGQKLNFAVLDTGLLYRFFAYEIHKNKIDPADKNKVLSFLPNFKFSLSDLEIPTLKEDGIAQSASIISQYSQIRAYFLEFQRNFSKNPPNLFKGAILDGRDIGTVVLPKADLKLFITAQTHIRGERRWKELQQRGIMCMLDDVLKDLKARDDRDMNRPHAPLKPALDAHIIDTSFLSPPDVVEEVLNLLQNNTFKPLVTKE